MNSTCLLQMEENFRRHVKISFLHSLARPYLNLVTRILAKRGSQMEVILKQTDYELSKNISLYYWTLTRSSLMKLVVEGCSSTEQ